MGLPNEITTGLIGSSGGYSGYEIDNSMYTEDDGSHRLEKTFSTSPSDGQKLTVSYWVKECNMAVTTYGNHFGYHTGTNYGLWGLDGVTNRFRVGQLNPTTFSLITTEYNRDPAAWTNWILSIDTTQATASDRVRLFKNGVQITDFDTETQPTQNSTLIWGSNIRHTIGTALNSVGGLYHPGDFYISELHWCDGQRYEPTEFGEFYQGGNQWRAISPSGLTYGTNGFYLPFTQDTPNLGTDYSGNGNDWTENGSPVQSSDSPTVNYATWNPLSTDAVTLSEGNLLTNAPGYWSAVAATILLSKNSGKVFIQTLVGNRYGCYSGQGLVPSEVPITNAGPSLHYGPHDSTYTPNSGLGAAFNGDKFGFYDTVGTTSYTFYEPDDTTTYSTNDLYCFHAFDFDNERYWVGTAFTTDSAVTWWGPSGKGADPTNPSTGLDISAYLAKFPDSQHWYFAHAPNASSGSPTARLDCGQNGYAFSGAKPDDYNDLSAANLPEATITDGSNHFETTTWTGYTPTLYEQTRISSSTTINNSMVFDGSTDSLTRTVGVPTDRKKCTYSFLIKRHKLTTHQRPFDDGSNTGFIQFNTNDELRIYTNSADLVTSKKFRDVGSFYHIVIAIDSTQATSADRTKVWVNGVLQSDFAPSAYPSLNASLNLNPSSASAYIGRFGIYSGGYYLNATLSEFHFIDGTAYEPTSFGEFNSDNIWSPKAVSGLTYGTNGFYLPFTQDTPNLGVDYSGNGNDWTENGSPVQSADSPTKNFPTFAEIGTAGQTWTISNGGTTIENDNTGSYSYTQKASIAFRSGKYSIETKMTVNSASGELGVGIIAPRYLTGTTSRHSYPSVFMGTTSTGGWSGTIRGSAINSGTNSQIEDPGPHVAVNDIIRMEINADDQEIQFYLNDVAHGAVVDYSSYVDDDGYIMPAMYSKYNGQHEWYFQESQWTDSPSSSDYVELCAANLPAISDSDLYFNGGSADLVWIKSRSAATSHKLIDTVRGVGLNISSNGTAAETGEATVNRIDKYGIHLGDDADVNNAAATFVAWMWKAGGAGVTNTDGTISSTVSVNDDAGFSIVSWTLGSTDNQTVGHGLSAAPPEFMFLKNRGTAGGWSTYHKDNTTEPETDYLRLHSTGATVDSALPWNDTAPTNSVFTIGDVSWFGSASDEMIAYCFRSIPGYSKVFSYTGNGSADGTFVYLGFKPRWVLMKRSSSTSNWYLFDTERSTFNVVDDYLIPNSSAAETTGGTVDIDLVSNGIKWRSSTAGSMNNSGSTYIGIAFAEYPFGGSNIPLGLAQ